MVLEQTHLRLGLVRQSAREKWHPSCVGEVRGVAKGRNNVGIARQHPCVPAAAPKNWSFLTETVVDQIWVVDELWIAQEPVEILIRVRGHHFPLHPQSVVCGSVKNGPKSGIERAIASVGTLVYGRGCWVWEIAPSHPDHEARRGEVRVETSSNSANHRRSKQCCIGPGYDLDGQTDNVGANLVPDFYSGTATGQ